MVLVNWTLNAPEGINIMQKKLFLDYLDGSCSPSKGMLGSGSQSLLLYLIIFRFAHLVRVECVLSGEEKHGFKGDLENYFEALNSFDSNAAYIAREFVADQSNWMTLADYGLFYHSPKKKNYVFSKNLTKALSETKIEKSVDIGREASSFYFEMPDVSFNGRSLVCVFGHTVLLESSLILRVQTMIKINSDYQTLGFYFELDNETSIADRFEEFIQGEVILSIFGVSKLSYDEPSLVRTVINGIIYIFNNSDEMSEKINDFAEKESKLQAQKKIFTEKPFIELGKNFEFLRLVKEGEVSVRGHYRWQPHGEGRRKVRLTFIRPYLKTITRELSLDDQ